MFSSDLFVDIQWTHNIGHRLEKFSQISPKKNVFNCRCPVCGDSKKRKNIKRFYIYEKKGNLNVDCKNCGYSRSFFNFMKEVFPELYDDYKNEVLMAKFKNKPKKRTTPKKKSVEPEPNKELASIEDLDSVVPLSSLSQEHMAVKYILGRGYDESDFKRFYYSENFRDTALSISEDFYKMLDEPRLVIPFFTKDGKKIKAIQGRSFDKKSGMKYITLKIGNDNDKIYGLESVDESKTVYCVEGPLDSIFIDNCIATCDAALTKADADVYVWDNEPRNKDTVKNMERAIELGKSIVVWPTSPNKKMDINDLILMGMSRDDIKRIIDMSTFKGLMATHKLSLWKKI